MAKQSLALREANQIVRMANKQQTRRSRGRHHKRGFELPLAVVAGTLPGLVKLRDHYAMGEGFSGVAREAGRVYLGFDFWNASFVPQAMLYGTVPIILGVLAHKFIGGKLGVNRALAKARIPVLRF